MNKNAEIKVTSITLNYFEDDREPTYRRKPAELDNIIFTGVWVDMTAKVELRVIDLHSELAQKLLGVTTGFRSLEGLFITEQELYSCELLKIEYAPYEPHNT